MLNWVRDLKIVRKEAVLDYSKALLGAMMLAFNRMTIREYIRICFRLATNNAIDRDVKTYNDIDLVHLIHIFCRLKRFAKCNKVVKDFLKRCVALMVSCENFTQFQEILYLTFILTTHQYEGQDLSSSLPSPPDSAQQKLLELMSTEEHPVMKDSPDENSKEFKANIVKLYASGYDPDDPNWFLNQEPDVDVEIVKADVNKSKKYERANSHYMPQFFKHLFNLAKEFPLWTAVNRKCFSSLCIRPTSSYIKNSFGELKNNIFKKVHGPFRCDNFFRIDYGISKAQCLKVSTEIAKIRMGPIANSVNSKKK